MIVAAFVFAAWAGPETPFSRLNEKLRSNKRKSETVWSFSDRTVQRRVVKTSTGSDDERYDAAGKPFVIVHFTAATPTSATMVAGGPVALDVSTWSEHPAWPGVVLRAPGEDAVRYTLGDGVLSWHLDAAGDPFSEEFGQGLLEGCGCVVVDRGTDWLDGHVAARWRMLVPRAVGAQQIELWALLVPQGLATLAWVVPSASEASLAPGRAAAALVRWVSK